MTSLQLELPFISEDPDLRAARAIEHIEHRFEKNRKALHMKNGILKNEIMQLKHELEMLKSAICQGQLQFKFGEKNE